MATESHGEDYFKVDPNMQQPLENHSCVERKLLVPVKLLLGSMKSASWQVGAAPAKPLTAAAQQLFGGRAASKGAASHAHGAFPRARPPRDRVSVACLCYFEQRVTCQGCWVTSPARDAARPRGSGYPQRARSEAAGGRALGGSRGQGAQRWPRPANLTALCPPPDLGATPQTLFSPETRASPVT